MPDKYAAETVPVLLSFEDGSVGVMQFVTHDPRAGWKREPTDFNIQHEIDRTKFDRLVTGWRRINHDEVPDDRTFRNAWVDNGRIEVDMPKAREIVRERLRRERRPALEELDVEYQRATEGKDSPSKKAARSKVMNRKQALRDLPADERIDAAGTSDELKTVLDQLLQEAR